MFPQRLSMLQDYINPTTRFLPKIKQTLERNAQKVLSRNLENSFFPTQNRTSIVNPKKYFNLGTLREQTERYLIKR